MWSVDDIVCDTLRNKYPQTFAPNKPPNGKRTFGITVNSTGYRKNVCFFWQVKGERYKERVQYVVSVVCWQFSNTNATPPPPPSAHILSKYYPVVWIYNTNTRLSSVRVFAVACYSRDKNVNRFDEDS